MVEQFGHNSDEPPPPGAYSSLPTRAKAWIGAVVQGATNFVYPAACPGCGESVAGHGGLCAPCWRDVAFISGPACDGCGAPLIAELGEGAVCESCTRTPPAWSRGTAAVTYEGTGRKIVLALKHADRLDLAPLAGAWMARAGAELIDEADLIAPTPLHWQRRYMRRFNQAGELARETAIQADRADSTALDLLTRTRRTPSQDGCDRKTRHRNVAGAFEISKKWRAEVKDARILLIDDVLTTGATFSACAEACRAAGAAKVNVLALARVARPDWPN